MALGVEGLSLDDQRGERDVLKEITEAAASLPAGSLVISQTLSLLDSMSATEIMDPRIDTGMITREQLEQPRFEPNRALPAEAVVAVIDELMRREMTFYTGHGLPATVYTCLYVTRFHEMPDLTQVNGPHDPGLICWVLRSYVLATMKTVDIVWGELIRGNLRDGEDFVSDKAGVYLAEDLPPDDVFAELDRAFDWLSTREGEKTAAELALIDRLRLRTELLYSLCSIYAPYDEEDAQFNELPTRLQECRDLARLLRRFAAPAYQSEVLAGIFDPTVPRKLPSSQPPRPVALLSMDDAWQELEKMIEDIREARDITLLSSWSDFENTFIHLARRSPTPAPFGRSLKQTLFFSEHKVIRRHPLSWLSGLVLLELAGWTSERFDKTLDRCPYDERLDLRRQFDRWHGTLAGRLVNLISCLGSNRPRQKRQLAKSLVDWQRFSSQVREIHEASPFAEVVQTHDLVQSLSDDLAQCLGTIVARFQSVVTLEALFSGFDLQLYAPSEYSISYLITARVLERQPATLVALNKQGGALERDQTWSEVLLVMSFASLECFDIFSGEQSISKADPDSEASRRRLQYRFEWIPPENQLHPIQERSELFLREEASQTTRSVKDMRNAVLGRLQHAEQLLLRLVSSMSASSITSLDEEQNLRRLLDTASGNISALQSGQPISMDKHWKHPWFPSYSSASLAAALDGDASYL